VVDEFLRRYLLTLWNTYSFFVTYANLDGFDPATPAVPVEERPELDQWIIAELHDTIRDVTDALENYDALAGGRRLDTFVDDLSNWYVRRSRRRFWRSGEAGDGGDKASAYATLHECLVTVAKLTAPFTPFIAEEIFTNLTGAESVHLENWPTYDEALTDHARGGLLDRMRLARQLVGLGRAARAKAKVKTRQPLPKALAVVPAAERTEVAALSRLVAEELNVKELELVESLEQLVHYSVKPNFRALGPRFGPRMPKIAAALAALGPDEVRALREQVAAGGPVTLDVEGETLTLDPADLDVRAEKREGYEVEHEGPYGVALDVEVTPELRAEGLAREVVRAVQEARKEGGLDIADRIGLYLEAGGELAEAIAVHESWILGEVLATERLAEPRDEGFARVADIEGEPLAIGILRS
jgi:isoleucyl-tRNA synthetase